MSIGIMEVGFVLIVSAASLVMAWRKQRIVWAVIPLFFLVATVTTPADVVSTVLAGGLNLAVFGFAWSALKQPVAAKNSAA